MSSSAHLPLVSLVTSSPTTQVMPSFANHPAARYSLLGVLLLLTLHFLLSFSSSSYSTSVDTAQARLSSTFRNGVIGSGGAAAAYGVAGETWYNGKKHVGGWGESRIEKPVLREDDASTAAGGKGNGSSTVQLVNATFVVLARNSDVWEIVSSIRGMEGEGRLSYHVGETGHRARRLAPLAYFCTFLYSRVYNGCRIDLRGLLPESAARTALTDSHSPPSQIASITPTTTPGPS